MEGYGPDCGWKPTVLDFCKSMNLDPLQAENYKKPTDDSLVIKLSHTELSKLRKIYIQDADSPEEVSLKTFTASDDGFFFVSEPPETLEYDDSYLDNAGMAPEYDRIDKLIDARGNLAKTLGL